MKSWCLLSVVAALTANVTMALGQDAPQNADTQSPPTLETVVVTAEKRTEPVQQVPVALTVVDSSQLARQNITTLGDLQGAVPELSTDGGLEIRGIGTQGFSRSAEQAVSVVLDGVAMGRAPINEIFDVSNVQVLDGPQGMLFGKNASAGVINIVTNAPDPTKFEAIAHTDIGSSRDYLISQAVVNLPLSGDAALRISGHHDQSGDTYYNNYLHKAAFSDSSGARARFLWRPTDRLTINLIGDYDREWDNGIAATDGAVSFALPGSPLATTLAACGIVPGQNNNRTCTNTPAPGANAPTQIYGASAQIDYDLGGDYTLTSITALRQATIGSFSDTGPGADSDYVPSNVLDTNLSPEWQGVLSQELRLTSPADAKLAYVAGLYYFDQRSHAVVNQAGGLGVLPPPLEIGRYWDFDISQPSVAAFGQATYSLTDRLQIIAGGRETHDSLTDFANYTSLPGYIAFPGFTPILMTDATAKTNNFSWKLGVKYEVAPSLMTYFTATRGYKGPMANDQAPGATQLIIRPEIPMDYELGAKTSVLDDNLALDFALFHDHVNNFQTTVYVPPTASNPIPGFAQGNAPYVLSEGAQLNFFGKLSGNLSVNGGVTYDEARYSSNFMVACKQGSATGCVTTAAGQLIYAPLWKIVVSPQYTHDLWSGFEGYVQADVNYRSSINYSSTPDPMTVGPGAAIFGGRIGFRPADGHWGFAIFARNLFDKRVPTLISPDALSGFDGGLNGDYVREFDINSYRIIGVTLDARW